MSEKLKKLMEAVAQAAESISEDEATRLQGVIQGYSMALSSAQDGEKAS